MKAWTILRLLMIGLVGTILLAEAPSRPTPADATKDRQIGVLLVVIAAADAGVLVGQDLRRRRRSRAVGAG